MSDLRQAIIDAYDTLRGRGDLKRARDQMQRRASAQPVPVGSGTADKAKRTIGGRQRQIDRAVEDAGG